MYLVFNIWMDHRKIIDCCFLQKVKKFKLELDVSSLTVHNLIKSLVSEAGRKNSATFRNYMDIAEDGSLVRQTIELEPLL